MQMAGSNQTQRGASVRGEPLLDKTVDASSLHMFKKIIR